MSETKNSAEITLGYVNSEQSRKYTFSDVPAASLSAIEPAMIAINASLAAGTDDGLKETFVADDVNTVTGDGYLRAITGIKTNSVETTYIFGGEG